jgi:hypothetical protein
MSAGLYIPPPGDWRSPGPGDWGKGGMMMGECVCEQRSVFPLLLIPHLLGFVLFVPILCWCLTAVLYSSGLANLVNAWSFDRRSFNDSAFAALHQHQAFKCVWTLVRGKKKSVRKRLVF